MRRFRFFWHYLSQHWISYLFGIVFIFLTNWLAVSIPVYLQKSIDLLTSGIENIRLHQGELTRYLLIMALFALSIIVVRTLSRILFFNPGRSIEFQVKNDLFNKLAHLPKSYFDQNPTGNIVSRLQNDITGLRLLFGFVAMQVFNILSALSLTPYQMWLLSPKLTFYCVIPVILIFSLVKFGMTRLVNHADQRMEELRSLSGFTLASLNGIDVIKNYHLEAWALENFRQGNQKMVFHSLKVSFIRSFLMPILNNLENILKILILLVGGMMVIQGDFTLGELTAFMAYAALLTMPLNGLGWLTTLIQESLVGVKSIETILSEKVEQEDIPRTGATPEELFAEGITVEGLSYSYGGEKVLDQISFQIKPHQTIGILGRIGSGKTTLVNCLNQYLPTQPGRIRFGQYDATRIPHQELRGLIKTVSQDVFLFSDSIRNNIAFGVQGTLSEETLHRVLYQSCLQEEVARFPQGVETMVGEKGIMLSGGQKQRLSLARAFAGPCKLLILDNVLSAVDYDTERFLLKEILKREMAESLLIVSHRVQALESADLILVLDQGRIVQQGTHAELIAQAGFYQNTWKLQNQDHAAH